MSYLQKTAYIIISFLLLLPLIPSKAFSNDSLPKRRIVTLIYDDSGSMWTAANKPIDNWKYANYALQSLVGLLDSNDELNVIPMSDPTELKTISLEESQRQSQMNIIRTWEGKKGTPIRTIYSAIDQINNSSKKHPQAEYWLIVLTDGVFAELDPEIKTNTAETVAKTRRQTETRLNELTNNMKVKDIPFKSALVTIESNLSIQHKEIMSDFKQLWQTTTNGTVIESDSETKIVDSINQVAALITNRDPDETKLFNLNARFQENRVKLKSPLPLRRITILHQTREKRQTIEFSDVIFNGKRQQPELEGPFVIQSPTDLNGLSPDINGSIYHIKQGKGGEVIKEGEYEVHFASNLTAEQKMNLRFLAEPAVDFMIKVNKVNSDGSITADESNFYAGSNMVLDVEMVQSESKKPIPLDKVDKDIFKIKTTVAGRKLLLTWDNKKKTFSAPFELIENDEIKATVKVQIEGLYQKEKSIQFQGLPYRKLELKKVDQTQWNMKLDELERGKPIEVIPLVNGKEMTNQELEELFTNVTAKSDGHRINYKISQKNNHILIKPGKKGTMLSTSTGKIPVNVALTGQNPSEHAALDFDIYIKDVPWYIRYTSYLFALILISLTAIWIFGVIRKPRFASDRISMNYERYLVVGGQKVQHGQLSTENFKTNFFERWVIPYRPERKSIQGILFEATNYPDQICLPRKSQNESMIVAGVELGDDGGKSDKTLYSNDELKIEDHSSIEIYTLRTS
ncbi:vWA domain-containing protein [Pseudoneobacillus sp. C159]